MRNKKFTVVFELFLVVMSVIAFSYLAGESSSYFSGAGNAESKFVTKSREILLGWLSRGLVSAQEASLWTCLEDVNGSSCQEYSSDFCNDVCSTSCFPGRRENFAECALGVCFDPSEGTCSANTPKFSCESSGGEWTDHNDGVPAQCVPGCCLLNGQSQFVSETTCNVVAERQGIIIDGVNNRFDPDVSNELACLLLAEQQDEGACVLELVEEEGGYNCEFLTKAECLGKGGDFHNDLLCSHPDLNSVCEKQSSVSCVEGEDGLYWIDSCGNRENIYDANKARSWNEGEVLALQDSCSLESGNNPLGNQERCGNCNYLLGSVCGEPREVDDHIIDSELGDFVCRDLSCTDEWGNERKNGESWCAFDSQIGVDNENKRNDERAVDVPGSRHYRKVCLDGEVRTDACADFRGEVCVENVNEEADISSAACRINQWQQCIAANSDEDDLAECEEHTDCTLHRVDIDKFEFDICTPRYPPGADLSSQSGGNNAEGICSIASQTCTVIEVKGFTGWKCKVNCGCKTEKFTESMNNLCISLGDCGGHVNVAGEFSGEGYKVKKAPRLNQQYINGLEDYAVAQEGQFVSLLSLSELAALFGVPEATFTDSSAYADFIGTIGLGVLGIDALLAVHAGVWSGVGTIGSGAGLANLPTLFGATHLSSSAMAFGNAVAGAAMAASTAIFLAKLFGLQGDAVDLLILTSLAGVIFLPVVTVIVIVLVLAIIFSLFGIGKSREIKVEFSCLPWQPPVGGDNCEVCNDDALGCSKYKCNSLGQTCELINEGTSDELCVDISPDDVSPPIISPDESVLEEGFSYTDVNSNGFRVEIDNEDGCIQEFTPVVIGIELNEPGQCKAELSHTTSYEDMDEFFGDDNLYKVNHERIEVIPDLDIIGAGGIFGDPERRGNYELFVRCKDASGNSNVNEYQIGFCVAPADDVAPPVISEFIPESPGFAGFNVSEKLVRFYTNEPADCKWSVQDEPYEDMENVAVCENELSQVTSRGWMCSSVLDVTSSEEQDYYFRCADKPWVLDDDDPDNDNDRNVAVQSSVYVIKKTTEELEISSVSPDDETIVVSRDPVSVDLEIHTEGGIDGSAFCEFSLNNEIFFDFFDTGGTTHRQTLDFFEGSHVVSFRCEDDAGNRAGESSAFSVEVDDKGPVISYIYDLSGSLTIITNEPSQCSYDLNSCGFNFDNGTLMSGNEFVHTTSLEDGTIYKVKCRDDFGNIGSCVSVRGGY